MIAASNVLIPEEPRHDSDDAPAGRAVILATTLAGGSSLAAQAAPNACGLLTEAEVTRLITRGRPTYGQAPDTTAVVGGKGSICDYPTGGQVGLFVGPDSERALEQFLGAFAQERQPRQPVAGVGDKAYVFYPTPRNRESDQGPYLVATVGPHTVTAFLAARRGQADGPMGEVCRGDQSKLSARDREGCKKVLADKSEAPESLQPAVVELGKAVAAKVRAGKLTP